MSDNSSNGATTNKNSAKKSIGYWNKDETVGSTCILIIHYDFADQKNHMNRSEDDKIDVENITSTFKSVGHICETSDRKDEVLKLVGSEDGLRTKFQLEKNQTPELFIVFIMTHGNKDGKLITHHHNGKKFDVYDVHDVCEKLKSNPLLENAMKLIFISACRGQILDELTQAVYNREGQRLPPGTVYSKDLDKENPDNLNATRVTTDPNSENFVIMFSCVEGTYSLRSGGSYLVKNICVCFKELDRDVDLEEFLTRIMWYQHNDPKQRAKGFTSTPEVKIFKRSRHLTIVKQCAEKNCNDFLYRWESDDAYRLLTRKAHIFAASDETYQSVSEELKKHFQFEPKRWETLAELTNSVSHESGNKDGCMLICVVAKLVTNKNQEVCVVTDKERIKIKSILGIPIGPMNAIWVGKPKICVFLNAKTVSQSFSVDIDQQKYEKTKLSISGTIHAGLLSIILPQENAVKTFMETLHDFTSQKKIENATFQQFFFSLLQASDKNAEIPPMVVTTLHKTLQMEFPPSCYTESFTKTNTKNWETEPCNLKALESLISKKDNKPRQESAKVSSQGAKLKVDVTIAKYPSTTKPISSKEATEVSNTEVETSDDAVDEHTGSEGDVDTVYVVSADAGSGKSELAKYLTFFAQRTQEATCVDLMTIMYQFVMKFDWEKHQNCLSAFVQECGEHINQELQNGPNGVLIIDAIDALLEDLRKIVLDTVQGLAEKKVPMWIFTSPEYKDELLSHLSGICSISVIEIDPLSKEKQTEFLQHKGFERVQIDLLLEKIKQQKAEDLISKIGYLAKLSTFPDLAKNLETNNIYKLSKHIVDTAIKSYLSEYKPDLEISIQEEVYNEIMNELTNGARKFFLLTEIQKTPPIENGKEALDDHFFRYPASKVSGTLAAYLCVRNMRYKLEISEELKDADKIASLQRMFNFKREILNKVF